MYNRITLKIALFASCLALLVACASAPVSPSPAARPEEPGVPVVGEVSLRRRVADPGVKEAGPLDIAVVVFDRGLDASAVASGDIFPTVRKAESILMPARLATHLEDSGYWGAVRVVHSQLDALPVTVSGEILQADGMSLLLALRATAADGSLLLERRYRDVAVSTDYPVAEDADPFDDLYRAISNDLAEIALSFGEQRRRELERIALMKFAKRLAPDAFADHLEQSADGRLVLRRFPASHDPMLGRLQRLRLQEYLFIDTVDQQYSDLRERVAASYNLLRQYNRELARYGEDYLGDVEQRERAGRRGSYAALQQVYGSFRKVKLQEEDMRELVRGFSGESLETVLAVDDGVVRLDGSVEQRYAQWRDLLARIYALESAPP